MSIYKAYDIRGQVPDELNSEMATAIGRAIVDLFKPEQVVVGRDCRLSNDEIFQALTAGITAMGADVVDLGRVSSPVLYFGAGRGMFPFGVMITASHNPGQYNGFKMVKNGSFPIQDHEIQEIRKRVESGVKTPIVKAGQIGYMDVLPDYRRHIHKFAKDIKPFKVVMDAANSVAGELIPLVYEGLPIEIIPLYFEPDGHFPNHEADPLKPENREDARKKLLETGADLACCFDGDADRVIFLDETGEVISGDMNTLLVALDYVASGDMGPFLSDCRSSWIVAETLEAKGAKVIDSRVGHSFIKKIMRQEKASFGGELSGHYYFKANYFTENSDMATLRLLRMMTRDGKKASELVAPYRVYSQSGEINSSVSDKEAIMQALEKEYGSLGGKISHIDGVTVEFDDWWFNVRASNTEPLLRLNLEGRTKDIMVEKRDEILERIRG